MGIFWDLIQQSQISDQQDTTTSLEARVGTLEEDLYQTRQTLHNLVLLLENHFGRDINQNGRIG
ncbi:MAG: hypothetical protein JSV03_17280 [Planctomycetota bacterium]|nr:MAG: hypothetical protein JSV03_17280 [Planctomycetota bacterium]